MCVVCKLPLAVSQSPQADRERAFIQSLVATGETESQIKTALVAQYGPAGDRHAEHARVRTGGLHRPDRRRARPRGLLVLLLPRWRRRGAQAAPAARALGPEDRARLDAELARYDG